MVVMVFMKPLEIVQNWGRWCECHLGSPPVLDLNGYVCQKCGKKVCVNCIHKTEKGFICSDCVEKLKPKKVSSIKIEQLARVTLGSKIRIIVLLMIIFLPLILLLLGFPSETIILICVPVSIIGLFLIYLIPLFIYKNKNDVKLKDKDLEKLDKIVMKNKK